MTTGMRRRDFLRTASVVTAGGLLIGCGGGAASQEKSGSGSATGGTRTAGQAEQKAPATVAPASSFEVPPAARSQSWDPVDYNVRRGESGFIPKAYMVSIHNPGGIEGHLGKHLPYVARLEGARVPAGAIALGWGDARKGYTKHPNAPKTDANPEGHWYDWIRIAPEGDPRAEVTTLFDDWPVSSQGQIAALTGTDPAADSGKNSAYLATLPEGVAPGDWVRVWAHCLTHGEYVDFVQVV